MLMVYCSLWRDNYTKCISLSAFYLPNWNMTVKSINVVSARISKAIVPEPERHDIPNKLFAFYELLSITTGGLFLKVFRITTGI